jgi:hypothetical protein
VVNYYYVTKDEEAMTIEVLAQHDVLNDKVAHFFKSGSVLRKDENNRLNEIHKLLPSKGNHGTNLEYDIWYDFPDDPRIHGYVYTDVFTKFIFMKPASFAHATHIMVASAKEKITDVGEMLFDSIVNKGTDKYRLRKTNIDYPYIIFLPGTNLINDIVDWDRVAREVKYEGAYLKTHPLTSAYSMADLRKRYGRRVIDKKLSGHTMLKTAEIVGTCSNSEMGLIGLGQGSEVRLFDKKGASPRTYTPIYTAIWKGDVHNVPEVDRFKRILSSEFSGLISYLVDNPKERIDNFFNFFKDVEHVKPKKPKTLNTGNK